MYKDVFKNIITNNLRYISTGWTRIIPYRNLIESHSINVGKNNCSPADLFLEFGNDLDKVLRLRCECKQIEGHEVYRFKIEDVENNEDHIKSNVSIQVGEIIKSIQIFETYNDLKNDVKSDEEYFPNAIILEFNSGKNLLIWGQEGDDQCEPCQRLTFLNSVEIEEYRNKWMKQWQKLYKFE